jgi:hypothetical protein
MVDLGDASVKILTEIGQIGLWMKTVGVIFVLWLIFQSVTLVINMRRIREMYAIKDDMKRMESKLDKILKKK